MAFIYQECDLVKFFIRQDFSTENRIIQVHIERGNRDDLLYYIHKYMEKQHNNRVFSALAVPRPGTPATNWSY